jgi:hypothetical protein
MAFERWACGAVRAGSVVAALLMGTGLVRCLGFGLPAWNPWLGGIGAGVFALHCVVNAFWSWPGWAECAAELDRRARTGDRFITGWELGQRGSRTEMQELAFQECAGFAGRGRFEEFFPVRLPPGLLAGVAPLLSLALLVWSGNLEETRRAAVRRSGLQEVSAVVERLEALAREAEERGNGDPVLAELAEKLRQGARDLKTDARDPESAQQAAMRELSRLEQMVQALQAGGMPQQAADMKALAEALSGSAEFQEMARALEEGRLSDAARALEELGAGGGGEALEKRIQQALERLAEDRARSEGMKRLLEELERSGGKGAVEKLQRMLRQMAQGGQPGRPGNEEGKGLKELLSALQDLKYGNPAEGRGSGGGPERGEGGPGEGEGRVAVQVFGKAGRDADAAGGASGQAGGERDLGTTGTPFGAAGGAPGEAGEDLALTGRLGAGETLSGYLPAAGDDSKAARRYKELYEALAPEAREAVMQEAIPIGSRFFIQRYFELIRPR